MNGFYIIGEDGYIWSYNDELYQDNAYESSVLVDSPIEIEITTASLVADLMKDLKLRMVYLEGVAHGASSFAYSIVQDKGYSTANSGSFNTALTSASKWGDANTDDPDYDSGARYSTDSSVMHMMEPINGRAKAIVVRVTGDSTTGSFINKIGLGFRGRTAKNS